MYGSVINKFNRKPQGYVLQLFVQALSPTLTDVDFRKNPLLQVKVDSV